MSRRIRAARTVLGRVAVAATVVVMAAVVIVAVTAAGAHAQVLALAPPPKPPKDLNTVIGNIRNWLFGLLVALATLFLTIGGLRYLLAGGDPSEVAKAKDTLKYAAIGYGIAVLAPLLVTVLNGFLGG